LSVTLLAGVHVGCFELFATGGVRTVRDLKGRTVAVPERNSSHELFISTMAAHVGLDPRKDIRWVSHPAAESIRLLADGKIDAMIGFPPVPQEVRPRKIGHVLVNSAVDRPWSQYFCCLVGASREFVRKRPVATKRALRALLKATDVCALEPERVARRLVDRGFTNRYDYALQTLKELPYNRWREYDPEDAVRFYALRLHESGLIRSSPQKIIAQGTDWRFLNELKKELKACEGRRAGARRRNDQATTSRRSINRPVAGTPSGRVLVTLKPPSEFRVLARAKGGGNPLGPPPMKLADSLKAVPNEIRP
jgi:NitT/TauT family transport system substrate-binding protein